MQLLQLIQGASGCMLAEDNFTQYINKKKKTFKRGLFPNLNILKFLLKVKMDKTIIYYLDALNCLFFSLETFGNCKLWHRAGYS